LFKTATDHGHIFWIQDGAIRSDVNLEESITIDLHFFKTNPSKLTTPTPSSPKTPMENGKILLYIYILYQFNSV
jgi:hypothetical protein